MKQSLRIPVGIFMIPKNANQADIAEVVNSTVQLKPGLQTYTVFTSEHQEGVCLVLHLHSDIVVAIQDA